MDSRSVGETLYIIRSEMGIGQDKLCLGLCTKGAYSKYEYGERMPDRLLLNVLLQRMGKNPDKLATILSSEEYNYFCWKKQVLIAVGQRDMDTVGKLLKEPEAIEIVINEGLQRQFLYQMEAAIAEEEEKDIGKCIQLLEKAVELTMPGIRYHAMGGQLISAEEMLTLLALAGLLTRGEKEERAQGILFEVIEYAEQNYSDYESKVKIYPKAVKLLVPLLLKQKRELDGMLLCKKAVELLRWNGVLYDLIQLMELYLLCSKELPRTEEIIRYEKQLQALKEVYEEYDAKAYMSENLLSSYSNQELYLVDEVIKRSRVEKGVSQELLSEGICTPETLSRIESGKRAPNTRNFRALMRKLDKELDYYNGELDTNDFFLLEKKLELDRAISLKNWEEACGLLEYLKVSLNMNSKQNQRMIQMDENCILFNMGKLELERFLEICEDLSGCRNKEWKKPQFWNQFFTRSKAILMNYQACIYRINHQMDEAIFILECLYEQLLSSKVKLADRLKSSMTVITNLSSYYGESGQLEKCIKMCEKGMELCLECGRGVKLGILLGNKAEALDIKAGEVSDKSRNYLKCAFYISDMMHAHSVANDIDEYYRAHYEEDVVWY